MFQKLFSAVTFVFFFSVSSLVFAAQAVNINTADAFTLAENLNGIGTAKAKAIIDYRAQNGDFASIDELVNVSGIGLKLVNRNRSLLSISDDSVVKSIATPAIKKPDVSTSAAEPLIPKSTAAPALPAN